MNRYRVVAASRGWPDTLPFAVQTPDGRYEIGDEFEFTFSEEDETASLLSGVIEIVPRIYKVIGGSNVHGADPGGTFTAALAVGPEALLLAGGHIERVDKPEPVKSPTPSKAKE